MITFDEFKKAEIKIGTILSAEKVPEADKLIKLMIDLGPKQMPVVAVVVPEGETEPVAQEVIPAPTQDSQGMVLYAVGEGFLTTVGPDREIPPGTPVQ